MSKKSFKSQASSSRAGSSSPFPSGGFGSPAAKGLGTGFGGAPASQLAYVYEPPDLSAILDSGVVVSLKNVQKKDSTTKAKALDELLIFVQDQVANQQSLDEAIIEAWSKLYPRVSIDNARRVRQSAHTLQGQISIAAGKRIARVMPMVIGAWLGGINDNDKIVVRSATSSFEALFSSEEKRTGVWKAYHSPILQYCSDAILNESVGSLSDQRTVSKDDAEAKYSRLLGSATSTLVDALSNLSHGDVNKQDEQWGRLLESNSLWKNCSFEDAFVRRSIYRLLGAILEKAPELLDPRCTSQPMIYEATKSDLTGSAYEFVKSLTQLTLAHPDVWTVLYSGSGKKSATRGLCHLLRKGSHGSSSEYWSELSSLLQAIPEQIILSAKTGDHSESTGEACPGADILNELADGIGRKEDRRQDNRAAWDTYLKLVARILAISEESHSDRFCITHVLPLIVQYLTPSTATAQWSVGSDQRRLCIQATVLSCRGSPEAAEETLRQISAELIQRLNTSLPEQSKDYTKSQDAIIKDAQRWIDFLGGIFGLNQTTALRGCIVQLVGEQSEAAIGILKNRNGKPYSAATVLDLQYQKLTGAMMENEIAQKQLLDFVQDAVPQLMTTPAAPQLLRLLEALNKTEDVSTVYEKSLKILDEAPDSSAKTQSMDTLLASPWPDHDLARASLKIMVKRSLEAALAGRTKAWNPVRLSLRNTSTPTDLTNDVLSTLVDSLSIQEKSAAGLDGLELALQENNSAVRAYLLSDQGSTLIARLLFLVQSPDTPELMEQAARLKTATEQLLSGSNASTSVTSSLLEVVRSRVVEIGPTAISIDSLVAQAVQLYDDASEQMRPQISTNLVISDAILFAELEKYVTNVPEASLVLTNELRSAVYLIQSDASFTKEPVDPQDFDRDGYSLLLRLIFYCLTLAKHSKILHSFPAQEQVQLSRFLALSNQIIGDHLNVPSHPRLWKVSSEDPEYDALQSVIELQSELSGWLSPVTPKRPSFYGRLVEQLFNNSAGTSPLEYYHARAYTMLIREEHERHGWGSSPEHESHLGSVRKSANVIQSTAYLSTLPESNAVLRVCNEVMSDLSGTDLTKDTRQGLERSVLLSTLLEILEDRKEDLPQQRLVFFLKHIVPYLDREGADQHLVAEVFRILNYILPLVKDLYGEFWADSLAAIVRHLSTSTSEIPTLHAILRLIGTIHSITKDDASEDLSESWEDHKSELGAALAQLLEWQSKLNDTAHKPLQMVNELLARQLDHFSHLGYKGEISDLFPVLDSPSVSVQRAAYAILSNKIPQMQEQLSLDAALSKNYTVRLPDELLSLVLEVPLADDFLGLSGEPDVPAPLMRYLLSWELIFAHWQNASYALQSGYVDTLKDGAHVPELLALVFDVLIAQRAPRAPWDPSKLGGFIATYDPSDTNVSDPSIEALCLLTHLCYLTLLHLPHLAKHWWRSACPRALEKKVEDWTAQHLSPLVAAAELATVAAWVPNPDSTTALEVRISTRAREVTAQYPIDEQHMSIRIALPAGYPLQPAAVTTGLRVGVDERRWAAWLNTTAIAINFAASSQGLGGVVDGLVAWRRNVAGTLKGQSECAICYSVVSADRQLPSKRCGTCKNMFHGSCLYRWFKSSSSSSCPLCRNAFNYA